MSVLEITVPASGEATVEESHAAMDVLIRDRLDISREEFLHRLDNGVYDSTDDIEVLRLVTLAPFAR